MTWLAPMLPITEDVIRSYVDARCAELFCAPAELRGPKRYPRLTRVRTILALELHRAPWELCDREIARALGRSHPSTIHSLRNGGKAGKTRSAA